jgi:hypothetical protein
MIKVTTSSARGVGACRVSSSKVVGVFVDEVLVDGRRAGKHLHHPEMRVQVVPCRRGILETSETGFHDGCDPDKIQIFRVMAKIFHENLAIEPSNAKLY